VGKRTKKPNKWDEIHGGMAFVIPVSMLRHHNFKRLSPWGLKLLLDLGRQYTGFNNGYLCASRSLMTKETGWNSTHTLHNAVRELEHYGLIVCTRHGGRNKAALHALTWRSVDGKTDNPLEVPSTGKPSDAWLIEVAPFERNANRLPRRSRTIRRAA
jgi:hypothetical protein